MEFAIPIGDYWEDGHGKYDIYMLKTDLNTDGELRQAYRNIKEVLGIDLKNIANEYQDSTIYPNEMEQITRVGFDYDECDIESEDGLRGRLSGGTDTLFDLVVFLLNRANPGHEFIRVDNNVVPLDTLGYGCFW